MLKPSSGTVEIFVAGSILMCQFSFFGFLFSAPRSFCFSADQESITVRYKDPFVLMRDLQLMGESNAIANRSMGAIRRDTLFAAASIYQQMYGDPNDHFSVPATFNVIYLCGWTPHSSQPKPKRRGSATHSFSQLGQVLNDNPSPSSSSNSAASSPSSAPP